ncbi:MULTISPECIES: MBL fold metallo-hydrolase [unclassified Archaeoglobus]|mgnify:CR=1 FL=1|jgi:glyoxylase-like metal-dependent hydrolase (beta-lactamase superfamily II)|uniref:MBL fold metallo-hydrolase n=1 Tax=unclassified Archaeoglobus TaxID=2643606 RepID=UPI0025BCC386|nr:MULTISPECIES: MBL fold metallo-hydrolase [unclassified Archaeoglobus]
MNILEIAENLYLVDLPQRIEGFRKFISSWVIKDGNSGVLVDVGPSSTIPKLIESLKYLEIEHLKYILLTHIHLDHAGGIADILKKFPEAKVVVHERGSRHLVNPSRLWEASKVALGEIAEFYGEPEGIKEEGIYVNGLEFAGRKIEVVETPGHAAHHQSYIFGEFLFIGEAAGVHMPLKNDYYLRPATPRKFIFEVAYNSLERLKELGSKRVCFGHFGFKRDSLEIIEKAKKQLRLWVDTVYDIACRRDFEGEEQILKQAREELLEKDRRFSRYHLLDEDIKRREDFFINNSLRGILDYVFTNYCEP